MPRRLLAFVACLVMCASFAKPLAAQTLTQRGFLDGSLYLFPQEAPNDPTQVMGDFLAREEVFVKPASWVQFAGGLDLRANSHDQVEDSWRLDVSDRGVQRPRLSLRRLTATLTHGPFTVDAGKQFIRWGKADILNPTDRFAPRDFLNVVDNDFIAVTGVRGALQHGAETLEVVWVPRFTPSRVPLLDQRWTAVPEAPSARLIDAGAVFPEGSQTGIRWSHVGDGLEYSASFFNGFNNLPNVEAFVAPLAGPRDPSCFGCPTAIVVRRTYPAIRTYGGDAAIPTKWFTIKGEAAYFTTSTPLTDEYVLYVVQLERQTGEWVIVGGYAGEAVTAQHSTLTFAPDRGLTRSFVARASYTIDSLRSLGFETAIRQNGDGFYGKAEYSQAKGQHWRVTITAIGIAGASDDFLGQYSRNSHVKAALRYSF